MGAHGQDGLAPLGDGSGSDRHMRCTGLEAMKAQAREPLFPTGRRGRLAAMLAIFGVLSAGATTHESEGSASSTIDLLDSLSHLPRQSRNDHLEQIRDWARLAVAARFDAKAGTTTSVTSALADQAVVRRSELGNALDEQSGPARSFVEGSAGRETLHLIISSDAAEHRDELAGAGYARHLALTGRRPARVQIHDLEIDLPLAQANVHDGPVVDAATFERETGKLSVAVLSSRAELDSFLQKNPDLVAAECTERGLRVTGREGATEGAGFSSEYLATLYQPPPSIRRPLAQDQEKLAQLLAQFIRPTEDEEYALQLILSSVPEEQKTAITDSIAEAGRRYALHSKTLTELQAMRWVLLDKGRSLAPGFSLDPIDTDIAALVRELKSLASGRELDARMRSVLARELPPELATALLKDEKSFPGLQGKVKGHLSAAARAATRGKTRTSARVYASTLVESMDGMIASEIIKDAAVTTAYQCARYEGGTQGTQAGMTFFYTDLLAKLWALDTSGAVPSEEVPGLLPAVGTPINSDSCSSSAGEGTRIWFGLREEAVRPIEDGQAVFFDRVGVRVFAKGRELGAAPGEETNAVTPSLRRFIAWFDANYPSIAGQERQYETLNQLMKWSALLAWTSAEQPGCFEKLDFLHQVPVARDWRFSRWTAQHSSQLGFPVSELPAEAKIAGRATECIPLLRSAVWQACGESSWLSGGVSGPSVAQVRSIGRASKAQEGFATSLAPFVSRGSDGKIALLSEPNAKTPRRLFEPGEGTIKISDHVGKDGPRRSVVGTAVEGTNVVRSASLKERNALDLEQFVDGEKMEQVRLAAADGDWRRVYVEVREAADTAMSRLAEQIAARDQKLGQQTPLAAVVRELSPSANLYEIDVDRVVVSMPEKPGFMEVRRARGPPETNGANPPPRPPRWRGVGLDMPDESGGGLFWRKYVDPHGKSNPPPAGSFTKHYAAENDRPSPSLVNLQAAVDAGDFQQIRASADRLRSAPARGPPDSERASDLLMIAAVKERRQQQPQRAAALESDALEFGRYGMDRGLPLTAGKRTQDRYELTGHATRVEPIEIMGADGSLSVDTTLAADGLLPAKSKPSSPDAESRLMRLLLPEKGEDYPRVELVRLRLPPGTKTLAPELHAGKHTGRDVRRATPAQAQKPVGGVITASPIGSRFKSAHTGRPVSWRELLSDGDQTQVNAAFFYPCDLNSDGRVGREEWMTCRCDTNFDGRLGDEVEQACTREMAEWLEQSTDEGRWIERRCIPSDGDIEKLLVAVQCASRLANVAPKPRGAQ